MRVHLIKKGTVERFMNMHAGSRSSFSLWLTVLKHADWENPEDIIGSFGSADLLGNGTSRVVFNIGGNNYRTICRYFFGAQKVHLFICWIGTHAAYTAICKMNKQYTINIYQI
jgi:mRNA interferase HigB